MVFFNLEFFDESYSHRSPHGERQISCKQCSSNVFNVLHVEFGCFVY